MLIDSRAFHVLAFDIVNAVYRSPATKGERLEAAAAFLDKFLAVVMPADGHAPAVHVSVTPVVAAAIAECAPATIRRAIAKARALGNKGGENYGELWLSEGIFLTPPKHVRIPLDALINFCGPEGISRKQWLRVLWREYRKNREGGVMHMKPLMPDCLRKDSTETIAEAVERLRAAPGWYDSGHWRSPAAKAWAVKNGHFHEARVDPQPEQDTSNEHAAGNAAPA
jgi:hypothetical protein